MEQTDLRYLKSLAKQYPTVAAAATEIINLQAILSLPKGTEHFITDIHGEYDQFQHVLKNGSGAIKRKIEDEFGNAISQAEKKSIATLIYYPEQKMEQVIKTEENMEDWYKVTLYRLIRICKGASSKYTRSKVRKALPKDFAYVIEELLTGRPDVSDQEAYYNEIIHSVIRTGRAAELVVAFCNLIRRLVVDHLHVVGDIFDRGPHPDTILDFLMDYHDVDFQWGNHDIVWMGAATGNWACIANILRMNISYNNFDMLEYGYGINLRPLASFAERIYGDDPCDFFQPHILERNQYDQIEEPLAAKMHKAIAVCQFKVEGQRIMAHPEYHLENRLLLDKINWEDGTVNVEGTVYPLRDTNLPTVDSADPYKLTEEEEEVMNSLEASILNSEKLQKHIRFLYSHGALYKKINGNLLYHGCIPMTEDGDFEEVEINGESFKGKALMDYLDREVRKAYFSPDESEEVGRMGDLMWYLWLGGNSPLFGKEKMTTFERLFIADKKAHKEPTRPYYKLIKEKAPCEKILIEFGLDPKRSKILNGHVPVKIKDGESPIKGGGLLYVIDGGISKAYQKQTGIAGYTFIFNSRFMALAEHKPYKPLQPDGTQEFQSPEVKTVEVLPARMLVIDTDQGIELQEQVDNMKRLVEAYRKGLLKEKY